jgi:hypothetical protein
MRALAAKPSIHLEIAPINPLSNQISFYLS